MDGKNTTAWCNPQFTTTIDHSHEHVCIPIATLHVSLTGQANLQDNLHDKVVNLHDKLDTFQNTTEASTRKNHHEVVELLQNNTNSSLDGKI